MTKHINEVLDTGRPDNKLFQYVLHQEELSPSAAKRLEDWKGSVQTKYDGVFIAIVVQQDKPVYAFSRTGRRFSNVEFIESYIKEALRVPLGRADYTGVYFGELVCNSMTLEELSGAVNPNRINLLEFSLESRGAHVRLFDYVQLHEFVEGTTNVEHFTRFARCVSLKSRCSHLTNKIMTADTRLVNSKEEFDAYTSERIAEGEEGVVYRPDNEGWVAGHKGYRCTKIVRKVSYDLECIGQMLGGKGKRLGVVTNLLFRWKDGKTLKADLGKGWTEPMRVALATNPTDAIGKVFKVYGLQDSSKGMIRLCKVGEERIDKEVADF